MERSWIESWPETPQIKLLAHMGSAKWVISFFKENSLKPKASCPAAITVKHALKYKEAEFKKLEDNKKTILWLTDSANMVAFLTKGSTKPRYPEGGPGHIQKVEKYVADSGFSARITERL